MVIVEEADWPTLTAAGEDAVMVKSSAAVNMSVAVAVWTSEPLVPVIVTLHVPGLVEVQEAFAVPDPVTLLGVITSQVRPVGTVSVRAIAPRNHSAPSPLW